MTLESSFHFQEFKSSTAFVINFSFSNCDKLVTGCILPIGYCVLLNTLNSNFAILQAWNCFQLELRIIWAHNFAKKKRRLFALFKSIFLRNARWFYGKKKKKKHAKLGREICIQLKIYEAEMKCGVRQIITVICDPNVQKDFQIWA